MGDQELKSFFYGGLVAAGIGACGLVATEIANQCNALNVYDHQDAFWASIYLGCAGLVCSVLSCAIGYSNSLSSNHSLSSRPSQESPLEKITKEQD